MPLKLRQFKVTFPSRLGRTAERTWKVGENIELEHVAHDVRENEPPTRHICGRITEVYAYSTQEVFVVIEYVREDSDVPRTRIIAVRDIVAIGKRRVIMLKDAA